MEVNIEWKEKNQEYLDELQKFFDKAQNIQDQESREEIIGQMLRCDKILTKLAINEINKNK